ncbi:MAG: hypothetical protein GY754_12300, partial [bacterium]|nr:hypothetical protein [bacterium]
ASAYGGSGDTNNCVVRVDNIAGDNSIKFASASYDNGVEALAVDRNNNLVYYATNSSTATEKLYRSNLDNSSSSSLSVSGGVEAIGSIYGMTVDNDGKLYISGKNGPGASRIFKYDPATQQVTISYAGSMVFPNDIMFKNNSVYVLDINGAEGYHVFQLNLDLTVISSNIGTRTGDTSTVGKFYGASRFLGKMNPYFYILDEDAGGTADRIIYLEDFAGTGWKSYGETGSGIGQFGFYNVGG